MVKVESNGVIKLESFKDYFITDSKVPVRFKGGTLKGFDFFGLFKTSQTVKRALTPESTLMLKGGNVNPQGDLYYNPYRQELEFPIDLTPEDFDLLKQKYFEAVKRIKGIKNEELCKKYGISSYVPFAEREKEAQKVLEKEIAKEIAQKRRISEQVNMQS